MAMFQLEFEYQQQAQRGATGWSETFWTNAGDVQSGLSIGAALAPLLRAVHSRRALMQSYSVRDTSLDPSQTVPRLSGSVTVGETPDQAASRQEGMYPTTAVRISTVDSAGRSADHWLRGMPDDVDTGGYLTPPPTWLTAMNALLSALGSVGLVNRHIDTAQQKKPVRGITQTGTVTVVNHGYPDGVFVRIGRTTSNPNIDGVYRISVGEDPDTFTLIGAPILTAPAVVSKSSYAMRQLYVQFGVTSALMEEVTKRNVGKPGRSPSGRQTTPKS